MGSAKGFASHKAVLWVGEGIRLPQLAHNGTDRPLPTAAQTDNCRGRERRGKWGPEGRNQIRSGRLCAGGVAKHMTTRSPNVRAIEVSPG
jgi:hypothetical protein